MECSLNHFSDSGMNLTDFDSGLINLRSLV